MPAGDGDELNVGWQQFISLFLSLPHVIDDPFPLVSTYSPKMSPRSLRRKATDRQLFFEDVR